VPHTFDLIDALGPNLILIDLEVGKTAGWGLLEQLQTDAVTRDIPVIVTSTDPHLLERAEVSQTRYGGRRWLAKPFDLEDLVTSVQELIGSA
jgi:CheY-like chemotaxis protein